MRTALSMYLESRERLGEVHPTTKEWRAAVPAWQWSCAAHGDFAQGCDQRQQESVERRPANALNLEIGAPRPRCLMKSPDGRGLAWLRSGGSVLAYGICVAPCPMREVAPAWEEPFCSCGRRLSECDGSRKQCWKRNQLNQGRDR